MYTLPRVVLLAHIPVTDKGTRQAPTLTAAHVCVDRYAAISRQVAAARNAKDDAALAALEKRGAFKDEGMALVLQILLMGECDALFGSYASNVAILVHDLMHARTRHTAQPRRREPAPPHGWPLTLPRASPRARAQGWWRATRGCTPSTSTGAPTADAARRFA